MPASLKPFTFAVLRALADGEFHSGARLAAQFGVSRASVSNALSGMSDYGLTVHRVHGRGYRLVDAPVWLDAARVAASLAADAGHFTLQFDDSAPSSNTRLLQQVGQGAPSGTVLAVEWQSAGRGRLGRVWHSGLGNALTFSLLWRFECGLAGLSGLSLAVGVALLRALRELGVAGVQLKWPNDALTEQGKLAGILIEAQGDMLGPCAVVIGIGINLKMPEIAGLQTDYPIASLAQLGGELPDRNQLLAQVLRQLRQVLLEFAQGGFACVQAEWESYHAHQQQAVEMRMPDGQCVAGRVIGVNKDGALCLETAQGERIFHAGEVSLRRAKGAQNVAH
jgi:BirA family transcriptional regulator, biotin operon repressor / biotin---[acetyl-CoA-carboxylase] ligase